MPSLDKRQPQMAHVSPRIRLIESQGLNMLLEVESSQLVLVDYQQKLMPAMKDAQAVWQRAEVLARTAKLLNVPVWAKPPLRFVSIVSVCWPKWHSVPWRRAWENG
jgi:hypothetical protein